MTAERSSENQVNDFARTTRPRRILFRPSSLWILFLSCAGVVIAILAWRARSGNDNVARLIAASSLSSRDIEPRLTGGFRWAPLRRSTRGGERADLERLRLMGAAGEVLLNAGEDAAPEARHAAAVAHLIAGNPRLAVERLRSMASARGVGARVWSDLAAAHYVAATGDDDPSNLARALVAVDAALSIDPELPEARFNRGLIIESLGLRDQARDEWNIYLRLDAGSKWADEARDHLRALAPQTAFRDELERSYNQITSSPEAARAMARRYPLEARTWGETEILGRWASAEKSGDQAAAEKHLGLAREFGRELVEHRGDRMLAALVAAIDRADTSQRVSLVQAHLDFRDGQKSFKADRAADAERILSSAAENFARGGSPGTMLAQYFVANTAFDQGRIADAEQRLQRLIASAPPEFPAHRAQLLWQMGIVYLSQGRWGECIDALKESVATFERLGEMFYAATVREILVEAYDRIGNPSLAWKNRMIVLRQLGGRQTMRLQLAVATVTRAALLDEDYPTALSFLDLEIDVARRIEDPLVHAEALLHRAKVHVSLDKKEEAAADIAEANALTGRLNDASDRAYLEAIARSIKGSMATNPTEAIGLLTSAIAYHSSAGRRMYLPELRLERGRAYQRAGDVALAAADFEAGVAELEAHRESLPDRDDRWGVFHASEQLFDEALALALARGHVQSAFEYAERARARALLDVLGSSWPRVKPSDIPADTAVVEFAVQPNRVVVFVLDDRGIRVFQSPVLRTRLLEEAREFAQAAADSSRLRLHESARSLYRLLLLPAETALAGKRRLAIVPDVPLAGIPFAALIDSGGRFLTESYALSIEPSAAVFAKLANGRRRGMEGHALVVLGAEDLGRLSAAEREAEAVARAYPRVTQLNRDVATRDAFAREAAAADVIHFAGHAVMSSDGGRSGYLLLTGRNSAESKLDLAYIASLRLPRTSVVVLAACGTASGEVRGTEGTISLARAFLAAGVPTVVATLWPIDDDDAAEFFPRLHQEIARGLPAAEALRATQLEWIRRPNTPSTLWTAVQVIGN